MNRRRLHLGMLWGAARLVPQPDRAEWLAEWQAELWYVERGTTLFCLGAFRDALWMWRNALPGLRPSINVNSPQRCLGLLAVLAAVSILWLHLTPGARRMWASPYADARRLMLVSAGDRGAREGPTVPVERYQSLANRADRRFSSFAFYQPGARRVQISPRRAAGLAVVLGSANLFRVLGLPEGEVDAGPRMVLGRGVWANYFDSDPGVVGRVVEVDGQRAVISRVIDDGSWQLPGHADAWLLEDESVLAQLPRGTTGFVVARLSASAGEHDRQWPFAAPNAHGGYDQYRCAPVHRSDFVVACLLLCALSGLLICTVRPLGLGEYPANGYAPRGLARLRRWAFLAAKLALIPPIVLCGSLDMAALISIQVFPHLMLVGWIAGVRWVLVDQRKRCPVCLHLLTNPTRIGGASQVFLQWSGTELICTHGHGMLYVPEVVTSCYGTQRWQYLDPSWSSLFS